MYMRFTSYLCASHAIDSNDFPHFVHRAISLSFFFFIIILIAFNFLIYIYSCPFTARSIFARSEQDDYYFFIVPTILPLTSVYSTDLENPAL